MSPSCEKKVVAEVASKVEAGGEQHEAESPIKPISYSFDNDYREMWEQVDSLSSKIDAHERFVW
jgi:hypothetical protein